MPKLEIKQKAELSRKQASERLIALGRALATGSEVELDSGGDTISLVVADRLEWELEIEVDGDQVEIEVEFSWRDAPSDSPQAEADDEEEDDEPDEEADTAEGSDQDPDEDDDEGEPQQTEPRRRAPVKKTARRGRPRKRAAD
ncbi:amphi-Trp domain-containing protein [Rhodococcus rhodochrous]|uniref:Amphi-Trp domain-containing protein n=1 Tax=Rhodococcus rhodochrous J45 TaxID=935266 RepID=A0A562E0K4_RHORH|nr:amphi-Trp domain-containing protein [Rhodococcus rhodochrous]TWH15525.1 amphi-Trp domain-containing protein [Rhodococcus rhodochrous J45]